MKNTQILNQYSKTILTCVLLAFFQADSFAQETKPVKVFIFAGQSNMVGSDSRVDDIRNFPPFSGLENPQADVRFSYCIGRENKSKSEGWTSLHPVNNLVGPELSFARSVCKSTPDSIAIIKVAAGGTHLGGDWNPDKPIGFKMYPLALAQVKDSLSQLEAKGIQYQLSGFMWHQGENDMFNEEYMANYGANLGNFLASWRRDLKCPELKFFIGELCTKTIWGMDLRPRMHAISIGQKMVTSSDPNATYVPTSHIGVEIGGGVGLHYHYGTLGQLEHGENYARTYLESIGIKQPRRQPLESWPYSKGETVQLFVLAGHRNMEGERAFVQDLLVMENDRNQTDANILLAPTDDIAFKYSVAGGYHLSNGWESLGPSGLYQTFGPELSFGATLKRNQPGSIAIAKFTHSGSQILDWTPAGSEAKTRNLYESFVDFVKDSIDELESKGNPVQLAGIFYHTGENDMSFGPHRKNAAQRLESLIQQSRSDLDLPDLKWFVSQQPPTDDERVNKIDVVADFKALAARDSNLIHIEAFDLKGREKKLVISTQGIVQLGNILANAWETSQK